MIGKYYNRKTLKLIVGSGGITQKGFVTTDIDFLDVTNWWHWMRSFKRNSIKVVLAEHVFEHLTKQEIIRSLKLIYKYLKKGGVLRLAIPDKNRKDKKYVNAVKPPTDGHKSYMNVNEISSILKNIGFSVTPLEYFNKDGKFFNSKWNEKNGIIRRSYRYDKQIMFKQGKLYYTSLILDAIKK